MVSRVGDVPLLGFTDKVSMLEVDNFITSYTIESKKDIEFAWNGKHTDEFNDDNYEFRKAVTERVLTGIVQAPDELLRDLFLAEAEFSREAWGASENLYSVGVLMLTQTLNIYVSDFFYGKAQSFDTHCAVSPNGVPKEKLRVIHSRLEKELASSKIPDGQLESYIEYFEDYLQ